MINLGIACAINGLAILAQPLTYYMQAVGNGLVKLSILVGTNAKRKASALGRYLCESIDYPLSRLVGSVGSPAPVPRQCNAALPWIRQLMVGDATFGSLIVLVASFYCTVYRDQSRIALACLNQNAVQSYFFARYPSAVKP